MKALSSQHIYFDRSMAFPTLFFSSVEDIFRQSYLLHSRKLSLLLFGNHIIVLIAGIEQDLILGGIIRRVIRIGLYVVIGTYLQQCFPLDGFSCFLVWFFIYAFGGLAAPGLE